MNSAICAPTSSARPTRRWENWATCSGRAATSRRRTRHSYLFAERFSTPNGLAQFFTCEWQAPVDKLSDAYPLVLSTVREVGLLLPFDDRQPALRWPNWRTNRATSNNTADAKRLGIEDEELGWVNSRKGKVISRAKISDRPNKGAVYMTYQWWIGACKRAGHRESQPDNQNPGYKYCAVNVEVFRYEPPTALRNSQLVLSGVKYPPRRYSLSSSLPRRPDLCGSGARPQILLRRYPSESRFATG